MFPNNFMDMHVVDISLDQFDLTPGPFCMSFARDIRTLTISIEKAGLINRPLICFDREGQIDIVTGYLRITALKNMGEKMIPCIDISDSGASPLEMLLLNLYENYSVRSFNGIEKGMILNRLARHFSQETLLKDFGDIIGVSNIREMHILMKAEGFPNEIRMLIADNSFNIRLIELVPDMKLLLSICRYLKSLKLNYNNQIQLIEYIDDISSNENIPSLSILAEDQYINLLKDDQINIPQKARRLMNMLRRRRLPVLTEMEDRFRSRIASLNLPGSVRIDHPPFFEAEGYRFEAGFKEGTDLLKLLKELSELNEIENITDPWEQE